ncbi:MAG TPA: hypothetical protein VJW51_07830 [Candidatus Acidoferrales bacterium]|nr:hypothetical protein [Candidatus Acidoferrales bacterium]
MIRNDFSALGCGESFLNLRGNFCPVFGQPSLLFVEQGDSLLHEFFHCLIGASLHVSPYQLLQFGAQMNVHANILPHAINITIGRGLSRADAATCSVRLPDSQGDADACSGG